MKIYELTPDGGVVPIQGLPDGGGLVCAFGCFDGVHVGHRALLASAVEETDRIRGRAGCDRVASAVWTFSEPVSKPWVMPVWERLSLCGRYGIRYALCQSFEDVRTLSPEEFIDGLVSRYGLRHAVCGYNFRFGHKGAGDPARMGRCLSDALMRFGYVKEDGGVGATVTVIDEVCALGGAVSSTRIRALLSEGDVEGAEGLLGRRYSFTGTVCSGKRLGRTISRPTVNLVYAPDQLVPCNGVYFTYCRVGEGLYRAVTNVGYRPTVNSDVGSITCETHLLDFSESVYGERIEIIFVHYHRGEIAFDSLTALSDQIAKDIDAANEYFDLHP